MEPPIIDLEMQRILALLAPYMDRHLFPKVCNIDLSDSSEQAKGQAQLSTQLFVCPSLHAACPYTTCQRMSSYSSTTVRRSCDAQYQKE